MLLAAPRTGSHLLLNLLNSSGRVFFDAELMNLVTISVFGENLKPEEAGALYALRANDPVSFLKVMLSRSHHTDARRLDDVAVRGFKLFPHQSHDAFDWVLGEPSMRVVHLYRENLLAEYSSLLVAYAEGHWVGGPPTDAGGLPVVQWSRSAGDLRVPHFFGIHAMHFVPFFAWLVGLARPPVGLGKLLVSCGAAVFAVLTIATFLQARAGLPFMA